MTIKTHRPLPLRPTESSSDKNADKKYAFLSRETRADYRPMEVSGRFVGQLLVNHYMLSLLFLPCLGIGLSWVFSYILENLCLCSVFVLWQCDESFNLWFFLYMRSISSDWHLRLKIYCVKCRINLSRLYHWKLGYFFVKCRVLMANKTWRDWWWICIRLYVLLRSNLSIAHRRSRLPVAQTKTSRPQLTWTPNSRLCRNFGDAMLRIWWEGQLLLHSLHLKLSSAFLCSLLVLLGKVLYVSL